MLGVKVLDLVRARRRGGGQRGIVITKLAVCQMDGVFNPIELQRGSHAAGD